MQCKYYGNCKHQNESCKSNTALLKCVYGLNEYCTEKSWENEVLKEENDTLKTEIMAVKSGSDVLKICKLEEENKELKKLLKLAVEDFERFRCLMSSTVNKDFCETALEYHCNPYDLCNSCSLSGSAKCKWRYADEAMKLIGDEENV